MVAEAKQAYKISNWSKYNESLVNRGSITFWFSDEALAEWLHANGEGKCGRPFTFSDRAIETLLVLRELFQLPYRQTEGLGRSLMNMVQAELPVPDFTSLAKRAAKLRVALGAVRRRGPLDIVVDSTGLKVFGDGEWKVRKHGPGKHRTWRKLHLVVNAATQEIIASTLTENSRIDASQVEPLLGQIGGRIRSFRGDGSYDKWQVYDALAAHGTQAVIPPQHNAKIKRHGNSAEQPLPRDEAIRGIRTLGRRTWKQQVDYHRRSLAETAMHRMKTTFGGELKNRSLDNQLTEARLRCKILNHHNQLGLPSSLRN